MPLVEDVLAEKRDTHVHTIAESASVLDAIKKMIQHRIGCLVVTGEGSTMCGFIAERDVIRRLADVQDDLAQVPVSDIMSRTVIVCAPTDTLNVVRSIMKTRLIRQMPVVNSDGKLVGIISIGDANAYLITNEETEISYLHDYIEGNVR